MQTETFTRKPFDVNAVQVTPTNAEEVAAWCGGKIGTSNYRLAGFTTKLNIVLVPGNGPNKGQMVEARIGSWVVEHLGNFRVYRKNQFRDTFVSKNEQAYLKFNDLKPGDLVRDLDVNEFREGEVVFVDQILVDFGMLGNVLFGREQLLPIPDYSPRTKARLNEESERRELGNEALSKINAMRAAAEAGVQMADGSTNYAVVDDQGSDLQEVSEINGIRKGMRIEVILEANLYSGEQGQVVGLGYDGVRVLVLLDENSSRDLTQPVPFTHDEIKVIVPELESGDMIETLIEHQFDGVTVPPGTNGRVAVVDTEFADGSPGVEIMFASGHYHTFRPAHLKKA